MTTGRGLGGKQDDSYIKLQENLPPTVKRWEVNTQSDIYSGSKTVTIDLVVDLSNAFSRHSELRNILTEQKIPLLHSSVRENGWGVLRAKDKAVYSGQSEELGDYVFEVRSENPAYANIFEKFIGITYTATRNVPGEISLHAVRKSGNRDFGDMHLLVQAITKYVALLSGDEKGNEQLGKGGNGKKESGSSEGDDEGDDDDVFEVK